MAEEQKAPKWRYVEGREPPDVELVVPGSTLYAADDRAGKGEFQWRLVPGHWELDLPPLPNKID